MPQLTFPLQLGELKLAALIGLYHQAMVDRIVAGLPPLAPIWARGVVDTGSSITCIATDILRVLGVPPVGQTSTRTAAGSVPVRLFRVSLSIPPAGNLPGSMLTYNDLIVMELINPIPDVDVLIGLDVLLDCRLLLDGPARQFTLEF